MKNKKRHSSRHKKNYSLKIVSMVLAVVIVVCGILFGISLWENKSAYPSFAEEADDLAQLKDTLEYNGKVYELKKGIETVLVLGLDKYEYASEDSYDNDMQADFLMLLVIDNKNEKCTALHINRDTIAEMSVLGVAGDKIDVVDQQIALSHTYGNGKEVSCRNTTEAVEKLLMNIDIDYYVSVTMEAVSTYNDLVGGVEVKVLDDFTGVDDTLVKGKEVNLMGQHALNYVRTRYGLEDSSNNHRMERQRQYIQALYDKTMLCLEEDDDFIMNTASKLTEYIVSNCSGNRLQTIVEKIADYEFVEICDLEGKSVKGETFMEFYPDEDSVKDTVIKLFYTEE